MKQKKESPGTSSSVRCGCLQGQNLTPHVFTLLPASFFESCILGPGRGFVGTCLRHNQPLQCPLQSGHSTMMREAAMLHHGPAQDHPSSQVRHLLCHWACPPRVLTKTMCIQRWGHTSSCQALPGIAHLLASGSCWGPGVSRAQ